MMRKTITRTMATSTINAFSLTIVDGKPEVKNLDPITIAGKATEKDALKAFREIYGKDSPITIADIKIDEAIYEISVDDFMKYAKRIDKNETSEQETEGSEMDSETSETTN